MLTCANWLLALQLLCSITASQERPVPKPSQPKADAFTIREFALDGIGSGPAIVSIDEEDSVWVALAKSGKLARFANGMVKVFDVGPESRPVGLASGSLRNGHPGILWIAASYDNKLIRFDPRSGEKREFPIAGESSWPFNVAIAPDGSIWFTERAAGRVGRLDPGNGDIRHYDLPTPNSGPAGLAVDERSGRVWLTQSYADRIATIDPRSGAVREYAMGDKSTGLLGGPAGLALDTSGGVWFAKLEGKIGYLAPDSERIQIFDTPPDAKRPAGIAVDSKTGDVWAAALDGNALVRYSRKTSSMDVFHIPTGEADDKPSVPPVARTSRPFGIAVDRLGNVWFSEQFTGQLGVIALAPPELVVLAPNGDVTTALPLFTARAVDRVSGVSHVKLELNSQPVTLRRGRLDFRRLLPGKHLLTATATNYTGKESTESIEIYYKPKQQAVVEIIGELEPTTSEGVEAKRLLLDEAKQLSKGDTHSRVRLMQAILGRNHESFREITPALYAALDFQTRSAASQVLTVRILDSNPYFDPTEIVVKKGDTIEWRYDPPTQGHSISHSLHRIKIPQIGLISGLMRAGEGFSHRFERAGEFIVHNTEAAKARLVVKVIE